jgi:hypothetical protein
VHPTLYSCTYLFQNDLSGPQIAHKPERLLSAKYLYFVFGLLVYWHCGHSWPIVPALGDSEDDCGGQMECILAGETEVLGENLPQRHFCPSQNPT